MTTHSLAGSRILITGGAGLIGSHIADRLASEDIAEVVVFDNLVRGRHENLDLAREILPKLTFVEGDITNPEQLGAAMQGIRLCVPSGGPDGSHSAPRCRVSPWKAS